MNDNIEIGYWEINTPFDFWQPSFLFPDSDLVAPANGSKTFLAPIFLALIVAAIMVMLIARFGTIRDEPPPVTDMNRLSDSSVNTQVGKITSDTSAPAEPKLQDTTASHLSPIYTAEVHYWEDKILAWSEAYDLDPNIVATIMQIESCGDPAAVSIAGAQGLFQVMPFHFETGENMLDPDTNAMRGLAFFREQLRFTGGDVLLSFAGYNGGYAASGSSYANWPAETQRYYVWAKGIYEEVTSGSDSSPTLEQWLSAGGAGGCQRAAISLGL